MLKPRTKLISLRMTEEEYEAVRHASAEGGARCVSDFARNALLGSARPTIPVSRPDEPSGCALLSQIDNRLTRVEQGLAEVAGELHTHLDETAAQSE